MDIIRRNTDYAFRLMVNLAGRFGKEVVSSRVLAGQEDVSYQLTCKLLQKLSAAGLVKSRMGPRGGFSLMKAPSEITLAMIVEVVQGPVSVNSCVLGTEFCRRQSTCPVSRKLTQLQDCIEGFFSGVTLDQLLEGRAGREKTQGLRG